jgi:hypothetical protein
MRSPGLRFFTLIGLCTAIAACSDSRDVTGPVATGAAPSRQLLPSPAAGNVVTRDVPLASPLTASAVIGVFGGRITVPGAGLTVVLPPLAVTTPTLITVTAVAGREVAYEFEPHGTQFLMPLTVTQSLAGTSATTGGLLPTTLSAAYFQSVQDLDQLNGTALVSELLGTSVSLWSNTVSFSVSHFSGYLIGTGFTSTDGDGSQ